MPLMAPFVWVKTHGPIIGVSRHTVFGKRQITAGCRRGSFMALLSADASDVNADQTRQKRWPFTKHSLSRCQYPQQEPPSLTLLASHICNSRELDMYCCSHAQRKVATKPYKKKDGLLPRTVFIVWFHLLLAHPSSVVTSSPYLSFIHPSLNQTRWNWNDKSWLIGRQHVSLSVAPFNTRHRSRRRGLVFKHPSNAFSLYFCHLFNYFLYSVLQHRSAVFGTLTWFLPRALVKAH